MHPTTMLHLREALAGEATAALRYALFADRAEDDGLDEVANLFERIGKQERKEHFRELAELIGLVGDTRRNLSAALDGEVDEQRRMYPAFADEARAVGDVTAADRFEELARDEGSHAEILRSVLADLAPAGPVGFAAAGRS